MKLSCLTYKILDGSNITTNIAEIFIQHLSKQGKVTIPSIEKVQTCCKIVLCFANEELIGIGALKLNDRPALQKAGLSAIEGIFGLELGYFFVSESFRRLGVSTTIARLLLTDKNDENILATTELYTDNPMMKTLEKLGFKHYGIPWKSIWHDGTIGVFLRFKKGIQNKIPV